MEKIRVGLLGAGNISGVMAETLQQMKEAELYAIASRSLAKAKDFAAEYGVKKVYGSYEELAEDEQVDLAYVATPMSEHYENVKMLLEHGKNVLCGCLEQHYADLSGRRDGDSEQFSAGAFRPPGYYLWNPGLCSCREYQ